MVAKFRIDSIAALARQMAFTPHDTLAAQIASAEDLLHSLEPDKAYPLDFLIFRITGYRPKVAGPSLLTGLALQHDLGLLIEQISDSLDLQTSAITEPVLTIDDVTTKFNVTSKTIQRWRRRGLPARRFAFPDGKRRVGFLLSSVERFVNGHSEQVQRGTNVSQLDDVERGEIIRRARRLATSGCSASEITRRIGRRVNRSPLTILHTVRKHDADHPNDDVFNAAPEEIEDIARAKVLRLNRRGVSIRKIARRMGRARTAIYRVVIDERIERLNRRKIRFIDDPLYHETDAADVIEHIASQDALTTANAAEDRVPRDLPPYLQELYRTPLLSPQRERALFLKFNFHKQQFVQARRRLEPQFARARDLNVLEGHLSLATDTKNAIVRANLRLVVSIARKHLRSNLSLMELVSEGNLTLMRAVEGFDLHRGNRFSTYATLALMKGFARTVPAMLAEQNGTPRKVGGARRERFMPEIADARSAAADTRLSQRDEVSALLAQLTVRERAVLAAHFGLTEPDRDSSEHGPASYDILGQRFGLSVQRIRQIERAALSKLRTVVSAAH